jgi:hypothetical protein
LQIINENNYSYDHSREGNSHIEMIENDKLVNLIEVKSVENKTIQENEINFFDFSMVRRGFFFLSVFFFPYYST